MSEAVGSLAHPGRRPLASQAFLEHIDLLVFVEATIYQMDEENEALAEQGSVDEGHQLHGGPSVCANLSSP